MKDKLLIIGEPQPDILASVQQGCKDMGVEVVHVSDLKGAIESFVPTEAVYKYDRVPELGLVERAKPTCDRHHEYTKRNDGKWLCRFCQLELK